MCNYKLLPAAVKVLETFLESISLKPFQLFRRILIYVSSITKEPPLQWEQVRISCSQVRRISGIPQCCHIALCYEIPAAALSWGRNQLFVLHFGGAFPSDRVPKATKDVNGHYFIHSSNSCKPYQRIPGTFWSYYVLAISSLL
jgi:hypothetical protein